MNKYKRLSLGKDENGKRITKDEHRYIMEQYLGRKLERWEVVHHKDGDKSNNSIKNLEVLSLSKHSKLHRVGKKLSLETKKKISVANKNKVPINRTKDKNDIINIVNKYKELKSYRKVDRYFGFSNGTTGEIIRGDIYCNYQKLIRKILDE